MDRRRRGIAVIVSLVALFAMTVSGAKFTPQGGVLGAVSGSGGVQLDGYGGVHPFGGVAVNTAGAPYWGWDIGRSIAVRDDGSGGWTLDGYGGIHNWGSAPALAPPAYWSGWDIARSLYVLPSGTGGYMLDALGGVHNFGTAPTLSGYPYWGWDIARGLDIHLNASGTPDGGWTLDGYGGIHAFGAASYIPSTHYYSGWDIYQHVHVVAGGAYAVARYGIVERDGSPAGIDWTGLSSWGTWDISRDVVPLGASLPSIDQPVSRTAAAGAMDRIHNYDRAARGRGALLADGALTSIAGAGSTYNTASCGGRGVIADRAQDLYSRNYFSHAIGGCAGTQYVFTTYMKAYGVGYHSAGENIAWRSGDPDLLDNVWATNTMWLNSPAHYSNIVGAYSSIGCGVSYTAVGSYQGATGPTFIWVCVFKS